MDAIILVRVSTQEQQEGHSLPAQLDRLQGYCKRNDMNVIRTFEIIESSTRGKRKDFLAMIEYAKQHPRKVAIVADAVDRVQRSFKESVMLDELRLAGKVELHFYREGMIINENSNSMDIMRWDFSVLGAKSYTLQLSENIKRSKNHLLKQGDVVGRVPAGYLNYRDAETGRASVRLDPLRSVIMRRMFETYATGNYTVKEMCKFAKEWGLTNSTHLERPLVLSQIHKLLQNPFYCGFQRINGKLYPHKYPPIIDIHTFEKCKQVREGYRTKPLRCSEKPFIFRGLIQCAYCGCAISSDLKKNKYIYLRCTNGKGPCKGKRIREEVALAQVQMIFNQMIIPKHLLKEIQEHLKNSHESKKQFHKDALDALNKKQNQFRKRLDALLDLRLDSSITPEEYDRKAEDLKRQQHNITEQIKNYDDASDTFGITLSLLIEVVSRAGALFESSKPEQKRQMINFVLSNLVLKGEKLHYDLKAPFKAMLEINKNENWWSIGDSNS